MLHYLLLVGLGLDNLLHFDTWKKWDTILQTNDEVSGSAGHLFNRNMSKLTADWLANSLRK